MGALVIASTLGYAIWTQCGGYAFIRLMEGDTTVTVTSLKIAGQQKVLEASEEATMEYLTTLLRSAVKGGPPGRGMSYDAWFRLGDGRLARVRISPYQQLEGFEIGTLVRLFDTDETTYSIMLEEPIPDELNKILKAMRDVESK